MWETSQIRHSVPHWRSPTSACWSEPGEARGSLFFHLNLTGWNSLKHCRRPMGQTPDLKHWRSMRLILDCNILVESNDGLASEPANSTGTAAFQSHKLRTFCQWSSVPSRALWEYALSLLKNLVFTLACRDLVLQPVQWSIA